MTKYLSFRRLQCWQSESDQKLLSERERETAAQERKTSIGSNGSLSLSPQPLREEEERERERGGREGGKVKRLELDISPDQVLCLIAPKLFSLILLCLPPRPATDDFNYWTF
mgnify:CR=1 FL=1